MFLCLFMVVNNANALLGTKVYGDYYVSNPIPFHLADENTIAGYNVTVYRINKKDQVYLQESWDIVCVTGKVRMINVDTLVTEWYGDAFVEYHMIMKHICGV